MESKVNSAPDRAWKAFCLYCTSSVNDVFFFIQTFQKPRDRPGGVLPDKSDGDAPSLT